METISGRYEQAVAFLAVVEAGSFTRAAEQIARSKAWVSRCVSNLERELGVQLLLRTTRRVDLTEAGRTYTEYCRQLRQTMAEAEQAVSAVREEVTGTLRVTAAMSFGETFMPDLLVAFQAQHPALAVQLDLSGDLRDLAAEGFDFGFRSARSVDERLVARALGVLRDIPVASPALLAQLGVPASPGELARLPALLNLHLSDYAEWVFRRGSESEPVRMHGRFSARFHGPLRRAAVLGAGVALLPSFLVADDVAARRLVRLLPEWEIASVPVYLVYPHRRHMPHRNRVFRDFVVDWFTSPARAGAFD